METTFKIGDLVIDDFGDICKIKKLYYASCVCEGNTFSGYEIPLKMIRHPTNEEIATWIAKKMLQ